MATAFLATAPAWKRLAPFNNSSLGFINRLAENSLSFDGSRTKIGFHGSQSKSKKADHRTKVMAATSSDLATASDWGEPVSLGTVKLPPDVNLQKLEGFLYQWGNSLTQNANLPLPAPLKVDKIDGGVRLGYIRLVNGAIEDLAHIDCMVSPGSKGSAAMFRALRCGRLKNEVPPGEPMIMQSLLQALKKSIDLARV